jgi:hypothetical protein
MKLSNNNNYYYPKGFKNEILTIYKKVEREITV